MNAGPHKEDMNLVEKIAFYAALVLLHGQQEADTFLLNQVPAEWHEEIKACVNAKGLMVNSRGGEFYLEHYQGILLPDPPKDQPW